MIRGIGTALVVFAVACDTLEDHPCPPAGTRLTYATFGQGFFSAHCVSCHGGPNGYSSRAFTTAESIRADRQRIFANAAAGNTAMPPGPDGPSRAERLDLAEWLACGAP
jgi:mono/diheme cytochrome c family protein